MRKLLASLVIVVATTGSATATEPTGNSSAVIGAVEAKYAKVKVMQADFVQVTRSEVFGTEEQKGDLLLKRPSMMRWNFAGDKQFVTDGRTMWVYTAADNQVIKYSDVSKVASTADSLLQSLDSINELFTVSVIEDAGKATHTLLMQPRQQEAAFKRVKLVLDKNLLVENVIITDNFDTVTDIEFSNIKLNGVVADAEFEFKVPAGAEVIDAGGL